MLRKCHVATVWTSSPPRPQAGNGTPCWLFGLPPPSVAWSHQTLVVDLVYPAVCSEHVGPSAPGFVRLSDAPLSVHLVLFDTRCVLRYAHQAHPNQSACPTRKRTFILTLWRRLQKNVNRRPTPCEVTGGRHSRDSDGPRRGYSSFPRCPSIEPASPACRAQHVGLSIRRAVIKPYKHRRCDDRCGSSKACTPLCSPSRHNVAGSRRFGPIDCRSAFRVSNALHEFHSCGAGARRRFAHEIPTKASSVGTKLLECCLGWKVFSVQMAHSEDAIIDCLVHLHSQFHGFPDRAWMGRVRLAAVPKHIVRS